MAPVGGEMQRGRAVIGSRVHVRAFGDERFDRLYVATLRGGDQFLVDVLSEGDDWKQRNEKQQNQITCFHKAISCALQIRISNSNLKNNGKFELTRGKNDTPHRQVSGNWP